MIRSTPSQLRHVLNNIVSVIRSVQLKAALSAVDPHPKQLFWRTIHENLVDSAVTRWLNLFGADERHAVHWKNNVVDQGMFRATLLQSLRIDQATWNIYWNHLKTYKESHFAQMGFSNIDLARQPPLELARESACFYYGRIGPEARRQGVEEYPPDIRQYIESFTQQSQRIAAVAGVAAADIGESVT